MPFIKSHSNYVLKSKHQDVNDGTIFERDITTIGAVDQFSPGQTPIYRSNNFIITVRNDGKPTNQYNTTKWKENDFGDTWTLQTISGMVSDYEDDNDTKIVLKQDYYDFRDFAYYGSLTELFRASVSDIMARFPGELYVTDEHAYYTSAYTYDFQRYEERVLLGGEDYYYVSNPFGIDIHTIYRPNDANPLKYFADGGFNNYRIGVGSTVTTSADCHTDIEEDIVWDEITEWEVIYKDPCDVTPPPPPELCECDKFVVTDKTSGQPFGPEGKSTPVTIATYEIKDSTCITKFGVSVDANWVTASTDNGSVKVKIAQVGQDVTTRETDVIISAHSEDQGDCVNKIHLKQNGPEIPPCDCGKITFTEQTTSGGRRSKKAVTVRSEGSDSSEEADLELYRRVAEITLVTSSGDTYVLYGYLDDDNRVVYLSKSENIGVHIRPKREFIDIFYNESDNFEKLLVNEDTHYKATFSVIRENDYGYYREFVPFQFPTSYGGYNLDVETYGFDAYTTQMVQIGEYYDENFTDNLWRSMTHEAIKNFDWTYTREFEQGDEQEYIFGGQRIQKALRIFAREFDEIISYINNIKNLNRVTYDERSNIPDYFLTDTLENEGWDVKLVYPYDLTEYYDGTRIVVDPELYVEGGSCDGQLDNVAISSTAMTATSEDESGTTRIKREFSQNSTNKITPYTKWMIGDGTEDGYFIVCGCIPTKTKEVTVEATSVPSCGGNSVVTWKKTYTGEGRMPIDTPCEYLTDDPKDQVYTFIKAECDTSFYDECALSNEGVLKNRIKSYTDETEWSYQQVNNEFLRRLKLNSRYIWRHKGTIDGLEMILGMFGMKSKRWVDAHPEWVINCKYTDCDSEDVETECHKMWDYDVQEYTSFTNRIEETWDVIHQNYRINWINSTKTIVYDNRFVSNYNKYGANGNMLMYQGIPVAYREAYVSEEGEDAYLAYENGTGETKYLDANNNKIIKRYLYPKFDKNEELDGHPYFQMDGGWLSKMIVGDGEEEKPIYNFQFDVNDNIVYNNYLYKGVYHDDEDDENYGFIDDNKPLYKETVRNIRRVDNIASLLTLPTNALYNGVICHVTRIEDNSAVIDNVVYPINKIWHYDDEGNGSIKQYISLVKSDGFIKVGSSKFFDTTIIVYNIDGEESMCNLEDKSDGFELRAYINGGNTDTGDTASTQSYSFICKEDFNGNYSISNFLMLDEMPSEGYTNYFVLDDVNYADVLSRFKVDSEEDADDEENIITTADWTSGWRRLSIHDSEYLKVNTITNYYNGNNPHNGNMIYDNGHEYFTYFNRIFKYATDNDMFDERCYEDYFDSLDNEITFYGFNGLIEKNENILQYDDFLVPDSKIHYFGNYKVKSGEAKSNGVPNIDKVWIYGDDTYRVSGTPIDNDATSGRGGYDLIYFVETENVEMYNLSAGTSGDTGSTATTASSKGWAEFKENPYNKLTAKTDTVSGESVPRYPIMDEVTNQIVNNKIFDITFRLHNKWYTKQGQEELKYIDDVVMNYLTQMIPSTTILRVKYDLTDVVPIVVGRKEDSEVIQTRETKTEIYEETWEVKEINCDKEPKKSSKSPTHWGKTATIMIEAGPCCDVEGDPCDCENCTSNTLTIANTSMEASERGQVLTTTYTVTDSKGRDITSTANVVTGGTLPSWITSYTISNGTITIGVAPNDAEDSQPRSTGLTVNWSVKGKPCDAKTINISQQAFEVCNYITTFNIGSVIPAKGITASTSQPYTLGTYTLDSGADATKISVKSSQIPNGITASNGSILLTTTILANVNANGSSKSFSFTIYYGNKECNTVTKSQANVCSYVTSFTINNIPAEGITASTSQPHTLGSYGLGSGGEDSKVRVTSAQIPNGVTVSNGSILLTTTIPPNDTESGKDFVFNIYYDSRATSCSSVTKTQGGHNVCEYVGDITKSINLIPKTGLASGEPIATFTMNGGDITKVSARLFVDGTLWANSVTIDGNTIKLTQAIGTNPYSSRRTFTIHLDYSPKTDCKTASIEQEKSDKCDCGMITFTEQ